MKQKQKSDDEAKKLQDEIQFIKAQKVYFIQIMCLLYLFIRVKFGNNLYEVVGSITTQNKARSWTIPTVESISWKRIAAGMYLSMLFISKLCFIWVKPVANLNECVPLFILMQLKKEGRRNEYERHKLQALNQRQKMVIAYNCFYFFYL